MRLTTIEKSILLFIILAIILNTVIVYGDLTHSTICVGGQACSIVQATEYGYVGPIKLSFVGLTALTALLLLHLLVLYYQKGHILFLLATILGALTSLYLISIQFFVIKQLCTSCLAIDALMLIIAGYTIIYIIKRRKDAKNYETQVIPEPPQTAAAAKTKKPKTLRKRRKQ